ncbi:hypothetical protein RHMOL_Rhmol11G0081800 [Rhododendron molle]|uniref:Uncharacterized protein n=1 Tax=Rhododendron molle TaxID=49168 RepID=A0ACC0LQU4_RHOML|nr:hypothetical protein RHMOL_Rhmol11G0081800 [Rhododendron molle]
MPHLSSFTSHYCFTSSYDRGDMVNTSSHLNLIMAITHRAWLIVHETHHEARTVFVLQLLKAKDSQFKCRISTELASLTNPQPGGAKSTHAADVQTSDFNQYTMR